MIGQSADSDATSRGGVAAIVDVAGAQVGGAARFKAELDRYLERTGRDDVRVIGDAHRLRPVWLMRRELARPYLGRRIALNNVSFVASGSERWTLLGNALHFLTDSEAVNLHPSVRDSARREAAITRITAQRADVLIAPCTALAERVAKVMPRLTARLVIRPHPVSPDLVPNEAREPSILCPVLFSPYKQMVERIADILAVIEHHANPSVRLLVTAHRSEVPQTMVQNPRLRLVGRLSYEDLKELWARCSAIYFPTSLESFGYPLAEARVSGLPVIAQDTEQNREIAGPALCAYTLHDESSLEAATELAFTGDFKPDPKPFEPASYFDWLFG
jgi:glycosyltransferase involved in cell wall biosynthesis